MQVECSDFLSKILRSCAVKELTVDDLNGLSESGGKDTEPSSYVFKLVSFLKDWDSLMNDIGSVAVKA